MYIIYIYHIHIEQIKANVFLFEKKKQKRKKNVTVCGQHQKRQVNLEKKYNFELCKTMLRYIDDFSE